MIFLEHTHSAPMPFSPLISLLWVFSVFSYSNSSHLSSLSSSIISSPKFPLHLPRKDYSLTLFSVPKASVQFSPSVVSDSFATPWITAGQASLSITSSRSLFKLMSIESVIPSSHLILCRPLLLLPPIPPSIRVFSNKSTLLIRWPKYWSFSFSISPSNEHQGLISLRI